MVFPVVLSDTTSFPDFQMMSITIYETFMSGRSIAVQILIAVFVIAILLAIRWIYGTAECG